MIKYAKGEQCSATIWGERVQSWQCQKKAVIERDGKLYCRIHDPEYIKAKQEKKQAEWDKELAERNQRWHRREVLNSIFKGVDTTTIEHNIKKYKAAPDLYEALKGLYKMFSFKCGGCIKTENALLEAQEALLKAESKNE